MSDIPQDQDTPATDAPDPAYLLATVEDGELWIDGDPVDEHPYRRSLRSKTVYYPQGTDTQVIESLMSDRDSAYCGSRHGAPTYTFRSDASDHSFRLSPATAWGVSARDAATVDRELRTIQDAIEGEEWEWARTVATLAGRLCREHATELRQLPARWRVLAHNAIHQGPSVVCRGSASHAYLWDRTEAFLRALFQPVPLRESWAVLHPGAKWKHYARTNGLIRATVRIDEDYPRDVPPLPVRDLGTTVYPAGLFRGVWTTELLADAVDGGGVEVIEVHEAARCETDPIHAWAGDRISKIKDKRLRKLTYTRYWGRLASIGGWKGTTFKPDGEPGTVHRFAGSSLYWVWDGYDMEGYQCGPDYRPDHAAFIASANHVRMNQTLRQVPQGSVIATHVDAIWTDDPGWYPPGDDFRLQREAALRFYGVGTYRHGERLAAQGYEGPPLTPALLEKWGGNLDPHPAHRWWYRQVTPNRSEDATSRPNVYDGERLARIPARTIYSPEWSRSGWLQEITEEPGNAGRTDTEE